jgi:hypothetical protein
MKVEYSQLNICNPNSGNNPAELDGTSDPDGTPVQVEPLSSFRLVVNFDYSERCYKFVSPIKFTLSEFSKFAVIKK